MSKRISSTETNKQKASPLPFPPHVEAGNKAAASARWRRLWGRCDGMGGARRSPRSPPSSVQPPQCLLLLGSLCFFARRNPKCLFGGGDSGGGEARRVDLPVTHFPPSSHGCSPRFSQSHFFWSGRSSQKFLWHNSYGNWQLQILKLVLILLSLIW